MIYVYDTTKNPWSIKKDWRAHTDPIINLVADKSSMYFLNRAQVISLGQDNMLRVWDGLVQDDWIGMSAIFTFNSTLTLLQRTRCDLKKPITASLTPSKLWL
jgi:hypothetical protein